MCGHPGHIIINCPASRKTGLDPDLASICTAPFSVVRILLYCSVHSSRARPSAHVRPVSFNHWKRPQYLRNAFLNRGLPHNAMNGWIYWIMIHIY